MNKKSALIVFGLAILFAMPHQNHIYAEQNAWMFYGKGKMVEGPLPGDVIRTLINNDEATIIHLGANGMEIVRMDIKPSELCIQTETTLCFEGIVTQTKNVIAHKVGDEIRITLDLKNKKEMVSFISGAISGASVTIDLSKITMRLNEPSVISLTQEGGIAGIRNEITIDTTTWELAQNGNVIKLDANSINTISSTIKKLKFTAVDEENYLPAEGSADYFRYSLKISQGTLQKTIVWTDTSENVPKPVFAIRDVITGATHIDSEESPQVQIAKDFVVSSPTFAFDGMPDTLTVLDEVILEPFSEQYVITIGFTSLHGGYGDRADQIVTQALTPHEIIITVVENEVVSAVIDGKWDELNQQILEN
ncbi:MAG: hypothetical protein AB1299_03455 [Thermoproteota archaeon]